MQNPGATADDPRRPPVPTPPKPRLYRRRAPWRCALALSLTALAAAAACHRSPAGRNGAAAAPSHYVETGDLAALRRRGRLRILMPPRHAEALAKRAFPLDLDRRLAESFARRLGLTPEVVYIPDRRLLVDALADGRGDLVVARLRPTPELRRRLAFSVAVDHVREMLVTRPDRAARIESADDLAGLTVAVPPGAPVLDSLRNLEREVPDLTVSLTAPDADESALLDRVARGEVDATVVDEDFLDTARTYRQDVAGALALSRERPVAWALRRDSPQLEEALDGFLTESALTADTSGRYHADLAEIRRRGVLRVLTRNNATTYFLYRGEQLGFDYELVRRFAKKLGVRVQVVVPREPGRLLDWLRAGRGDLVAASLTANPGRRRQAAFTRPYAHASELVVVRTGAAIETPADLAGHTVWVARSSSYFPRLQALRREVDFRIRAAPERMEADEMIAAVADGTYDVTVVDSNMLDVELTWRDEVESAFALGPPLPVGWAVRPGDSRLLAAADRFLQEQQGSRFLRVLRQKYFTDRETVSRRARALPLAKGSLSPFDDVFREVALRVSIDWRLLVSQAYQESRFDPTARSWAGAIGLMQVMPRTARHMGVEGDLRDPETSVAAGAAYMHWLLARYDEPGLPLAERLRFALASYNAGRGHLLDARRLAREKGLDPDRWGDNVERVMPLLARNGYARRARYGYCRCTEAVDYVDQINERYLAYVQIEERRHPW